MFLAVGFFYYKVLARGCLGFCELACRGTGKRKALWRRRACVGVIELLRGRGVAQAAQFAF